MIRKILLVDNDQILQLTLNRKMAEFGDDFQVVQAVDGFDALKKLEKTAFSLICTDLMMPRMDGMSLISHIRTKYPDLPVIVISGMKRKDMPAIEQVNGLIAYLEKPFPVNELLELILNTLREEAKEGIMHNVSPTMFMQLMEMEEKTCTIRMLDNASDEGGILYLKDGQLLDARVGGFRGIEAATRIFFWDEVTVFLRHECTPRENVINSEIQAIIMVALVAKDEHADSFATAKSGGVSPSVVIGDGKGFEGSKNSSLDKLREVIEREFGEQSGIGAIYRDVSMVSVNRRLDKLGVLSGFGALQAGYMERGQGKNTILLPGDPPILLDAKPECPVEDLLKVLKNRA